MSTPENPYQPPSSIQTGSDPGLLGDSIAINGEVTFDDVASLFPIPWAVRVLQGLVVVVCLPMFLVMGAGLLFFGSPDVSMIPLVLIEIFLVGVAWFSLWWLGRSRQTRRLLARHPGMLGPIHGSLDGFGLRFFSEGGNQWQQVSWSAFQAVDVNRNGIRLAWGHVDDAFIAIPATAIDGFQTAPVSVCLHDWKTRCTEPPQIGVIEDWQGLPDKAIAFRQLAPVQQHASLPLLHPVNLFSAVACIGVVIWSPGLVVVVVVFGVIMAISSVIAGRYYPHHVSLVSISQWGWLTQSGFRLHYPGGYLDLAWADVERIQLDDDKIEVTIHPEHSFTIGADDITDDRLSWGRVQSWIRDARSKPNRA